MPPWRNARSSTQRMEASSSTSQTLSDLIGVCNMEWQQDSEDGLSGAAVVFDQSVVAAHQVLSQREAEAGAVGASCHERIKQGVAQLIGHAYAGVLELHAGDQSMTTRTDAHIRECACAQGNSATRRGVLRDGLHGVA